MKIEEIKNLTDKELAKKVLEMKEEMFNLRFAQATGNLQNPMQLHNLKKDIAKIKTIQNQRRV
ncbi:MAG: 50S ribosomal protein L29 [Clostridia bacterium]